MIFHAPVQEVKSSNTKKGNTAESSYGKEQEMRDINITKTEKSGMAAAVIALNYFATISTQ